MRCALETFRYMRREVVSTFQLVRGETVSTSAQLVIPSAVAYAGLLFEQYDFD